MLKIAEIQRHGKGELLNKMRSVTLLKKPDVEVYAEVDLDLMTVDPATLEPTQRYLLGRNLQAIQGVNEELEAHGVNPWRLNGYVSFRLEGEDTWRDFLPPVVEETTERDGSQHWVINDGMHRVYRAYIAWTPIQVVRVQGLPEGLPYYAYPLRRGWDEVELLDSIPEGYVKKWHRIRDKHSLYRDFNSAFENVGAPRGQG